MARRSIYLSAMLAAIVCVSGATALGATPTLKPKLKQAAVRQLALHASQFIPPGGTYQPDNRLSVEGVRLTKSGRNLLWLVHVHANLGGGHMFPCRLPAPGAPAPSCAGARSEDALLTIGDATGRVVSLRAANQTGVPLPPLARG